jgi:hypothetical protein
MKEVNKFWEARGDRHATSKSQLDRQIKELLPYITSTYECSKSEAENMISIVFGAMVQKLFHTGIVKTPVGRMVFTVKPKETYPLRISIFTNYPTTKFLNTGELDRPVPLQECMLPEHYELLVDFQKKAWAYKEEKRLEKEAMDDEV